MEVRISNAKATEQVPSGKNIDIDVFTFYLFYYLARCSNLSGSLSVSLFFCFFTHVHSVKHVQYI